MREIIITRDAEESFDEILRYIMIKSGATLAGKIYDRIVTKIHLLSSVSFRGKVSEELKSIGITDIYELIEAPWKIYYRLKQKQVIILLVLDSRRNLEEVLIDKIINKKD